MNNMVVVLLKSSKHEAFYRDFNKSLDFPVLLSWAIFYIDLVPQYITFRISYDRFPVSLFINKYTTYNNEQFGGCIIKIKHFLKHFTGILTKSLISQCSLIGRFFYIDLVPQYLTLKISESTGDLSKKSFPATLAAILNFCIKRKMFVSETERARSILAKFFTHRVSAYCIHRRHPMDTLV